MFEKETEIYALSNYGFRGKNSQRVFTAKIDYQKGAEFGYNKAREWHYIKDKLPPETEADDKQMFPKNYICAYALNNEYNDYEVGEFVYFGHGEWNGENKNYPIYAWLETPVEVPEPSKELYYNNGQNESYSNN